MSPPRTGVSDEHLRSKGTPSRSADGSFDTEIHWNGYETTYRNGLVSRQSKCRKMNSNHEYTITFCEVSYYIPKSRNAREMARAFKDSMLAHRDLYNHANIVHGDINLDTLATFQEGRRRGVLKDWDMPLSKMHIDICGPVDMLISDKKYGGKEIDRDILMERVQASLATLNEQNRSWMREKGIPTEDNDIDRGEQLRRTTVGRITNDSDSYWSDDINGLDSDLESMASLD